MLIVCVVWLCFDLVIIVFIHGLFPFLILDVAFQFANLTDDCDFNFIDESINYVIKVYYVIILFYLIYYVKIPIVVLVLINCQR